MSGVIVSNYFLETMGHPSSLMQGTITALYDVGAVFGALGAAVAAEPLGRKRTLCLGATVLAIGTIIMGTSYERVQFMVSRVITGVGIGAYSPFLLHVGLSLMMNRLHHKCHTGLPI